MNKFIVTIAIILLAFTVGLANLEAQNSFTVKPGKVETEALPGLEKEIFIEVTNNLGQDYEFEVSVKDISYKEGEGLIFHQDNLGPYSLKNYVATPDDTVLIKNNETARLRFTVLLPENSPPGSRHGVVLASPIMQPEGEGQAFVSSQIGALLFVRVPGDVLEVGNLADFKAFDDLVFGNEAQGFAIAFNNTGNTYLNPYGVISIKNWRGKEVAVMPIDPWFVLPNSIRSREIEAQKLSTGFYKAELNLNSGFDNKIVKETVSFWSVSIGALISGILLFFVLVLLVLAVLKFKRR